MLVDDEADIVTSVTKGLESHGFEVHAFTKPIHALSHFRSHDCDAIILDVRMPEMTGFELARKIWQLEVNQRICFFSAFEQFENEALNTFYNKKYCFIKKPVSISTLISHIDRHLSKAAIVG
jgi:DNA-binding response OmpR family regulator